VRPAPTLFGSKTGASGRPSGENERTNEGGCGDRERERRFDQSGRGNAVELGADTVPHDGHQHVPAGIDGRPDLLRSEEGVAGRSFVDALARVLVRRRERGERGEEPARDEGLAGASVLEEIVDAGERARCRRARGDAAGQGIAVGGHDEAGVAGERAIVVVRRARATRAVAVDATVLSGIAAAAATRVGVRKAKAEIAVPALLDHLETSRGPAHAEGRGSGAEGRFAGGELWGDRAAVGCRREHDGVLRTRRRREDDGDGVVGGVRREPRGLIARPEADLDRLSRAGERPIDHAERTDEFAPLAGDQVAGRMRGRRGDRGCQNGSQQHERAAFRKQEARSLRVAGHSGGSNQGVALTGGGHANLHARATRTPHLMCENAEI
jgi:hypothetical protein